MPSIVSFPKILGFVICCQWVLFCSDGKGVVIVPQASDAFDSPATTGELTEKASLHSPRAVLAISVLRGDGRFLKIEEPPVPPPQLDLALPNGMAVDELPAASPITRAAHKFSRFATMTLTTFSGEFKSPEEFAHFQEVLGPMVELLGVIMKGERDSVEEVGKRIDTLEAQVWQICHDALDKDKIFVWGSIPASSAVREPTFPYLKGLPADEFYLVRSVLDKVNDPKENLEPYMRNSITRESFGLRLEQAMRESEWLLKQIAEQYKLLSAVSIVSKPKITTQHYGGDMG